MNTTRREFLLHSAAAGVALPALGLAMSAAATGATSPAPKKLKILFLGGTGFLGPHTVEHAIARGHEVTLFNRGRTNTDLFPDLEKIVGNRDPEVDEGLDPLRELIDSGRRWDAVIDTSAYVPRISRASAELLKDAVDHYVFVSTISVYPSFPEHGMDETAPVGTLDDPTTEEITGGSYGPLKALCEQSVEEAMPGQVSNVRPGLIVGPMDPTGRFTYWPLRVDRGGNVLAPGDPGGPCQFVDVRDLGAFMIACAEDRVAGVYNATGFDAPLTFAEFLYACKAVTRTDVTFTWVSGEFLTEQGVAPWQQLPLWIPGEGDYLGFATVSNQRALDAGLSFRPIGETIRDTIDWWETLPEDRRARAIAQNEDPRIPGLAPTRELELLAAWDERSSDDAADDDDDDPGEDAG